MEIDTHTMTAEFSDDRITMLMSKTGHGCADIADKAPRLCCLKPAAQALFSDRYQILFLFIDLADHKHSGSIGIVAVINS